jgi:DNA sulfur modification protein DndC
MDFPEEVKTFKIFDNLIKKNRKWMITFSGGKDSTLLLHLVLKYLTTGNNIDRIKHVKVVYVNTLLEFPSIREWINKFLDSIEEFVRNNPQFHDKFDVVRILPERDFIYNMILKKPPHYPLPHWRFPWCKKDLKIIPSEKNKGDYLVLVGVRKDESIERRKYNNPNKKIFSYKAMPIFHWTTERVFEYLIKNDPPFWTTTLNSIKISYKIDLIKKVYWLEFDEEVTLKEQSLLRYGCWLCPMATYRDQKPILNGYEDLSKIRKLMYLVNIDSKNRIFKNGRKRGLNLRGRVCFAIIFSYILKRYPELFDDYIKFKRSVIIDMLHFLLSQKPETLNDVLKDIKTKSKKINLDFNINIDDIKELFFKLNS